MCLEKQLFHIDTPRIVRKRDRTYNNRVRGTSVSATNRNLDFRLECIDRHELLTGDDVDVRIDAYLKSTIVVRLTLSSLYCL
jgi:hypothetical protein